MRKATGFFVTLALAALLVSAVSGAAFARGGGGGKGGGGTTSGANSLTLKMVVDANGNTLPNWGDTITFNLTTSATKPFVSLNCYQGTNWVYAASVGYFPAYPWAKEFTLAATSWPGGGADCTAKLYTTKDGRRTRTLATLPVHVNA
jgi:hypothetical protein